MHSTERRQQWLLSTPRSNKNLVTLHRDQLLDLYSFHADLTQLHRSRKRHCVVIWSYWINLEKYKTASLVGAFRWGIRLRGAGGRFVFNKSIFVLAVDHAVGSLSIWPDWCPEWSNVIDWFQIELTKFVRLRRSINLKRCFHENVR